ncbi:MAG: hypothetical protein NVSMB64_04750 [Candidatus Velthaea sp.]
MNMDVASYAIYDPGAAALLVPTETVVRSTELFAHKAAGSLVDRDV